MLTIDDYLLVIVEVFHTLMNNEIKNKKTT